jgi:hypothetical protein
MSNPICDAFDTSTFTVFSPANMPAAACSRADPLDSRSDSFRRKVPFLLAIYYYQTSNFF